MTDLEALARATDELATLERELETEVHDLLRELDRHCDSTWARVEVDDYTLEIRTVSSNIGECAYWYLTDPHGERANLELVVDAECCLHGDFRAQMHGPTADQLRAFATRAPQFVAALVELARANTAASRAGLEAVAAARKGLPHG